MFSNFSSGLLSRIDQLVVLSADIGKKSINVFYRQPNHPEGVVSQTKTAFYHLRRRKRGACLNQPAACLKIPGSCNNRYPGIIVPQVRNCFKSSLFPVDSQNKKRCLLRMGSSQKLRIGNISVIYGESVFFPLCYAGRIIIKDDKRTLLAWRSTATTWPTRP